MNNAEQQIQTTLNDLDGAIKYIVNGDNEHPNRQDVCKAKGARPTQPQASALSQQNRSTFGQPSSSARAFSQPSVSLAFGGGPSASSFGQSSAPTSTFGQPSSSTSTFGQPPASTFGQPSQPSAFGQASTLGRPGTSFGQASSTFGKPSIPAPTFGQPSASGPFGAPQQLNAFGKASRTESLPQTTAPAKNPFANPQAPTQSSTFGQPSAPSQPSAFGRPSTSNPSPAFGQPAISGAASGFAQTSTAPGNPFAQSVAPSTTPIFSQPSTAVPSPFGQRKNSSANQPVPSFGQSSSHSSTNRIPPEPAPNRTDVRTTSGQGTNGVQTQKDSQNKITSWKGMPVRYFDDEPCYKGNDGSWQRIWFPDGPPVFMKTVDLPDAAYDDATKTNYQHLRETGTFKDGIMPILPPKREWCSWTF